MSYKNKEDKNKYMKKYRELNKELLYEKTKIYKEKNKDKITNYQKDYYEKNKEYALLYANKKYNELNKEELKEYKEYKKLYYEKNKEKLKEKAKIYRENNKEKLKEKRIEKGYTKRKSHIRMWRKCLYHTLERLGKKKEGHTIDILGYSALELKEYITPLFLDGMTWDNYGKWHLDHIIPVSAFKEDTPVDIVCSLSNLQPLWAKDNLSKSNKLDNINMNLLFKNIRYLKNNCFDNE